MYTCCCCVCMYVHIYVYASYFTYSCLYVCWVQVSFIYHQLSLCILFHTGSYMLMHMWKQREKKIGSKSANAMKKGESKDTKQE